MVVTNSGGVLISSSKGIYGEGRTATTGWTSSMPAECLYDNVMPHSLTVCLVYLRFLFQLKHVELLGPQSTFVSESIN